MREARGERKEKYGVCMHSMVALRDGSLPFHYVCSGDQIQVVRLGGKCLYQMSRHFSSPH